MPAPLFLAVSRQPDESLQQWLYRAIKSAILNGRLPAGAPLPASRSLAAEQGIARNTVLRAYEQLLAEGFVAADRQGTRVATLSAALKAAPPSDAPPVVRGVLSHRARELPGRFGEPLLPFAPGVPDLNAFPWSRWSRQLQHAWGEVSARQLAQAAPGGEPALRKAIADLVRVRRGVDCRPEQVFVVAGGHLALDACARLLADAGDTVWLENPGYPSARSAMLAAGLNTVSVLVDAQGLTVNESLWTSSPPRLIYLTPACQYPLGTALSLERRLALLGRAEAGKQWIIEDDYGSEFNHERPGQSPLPAMQSLIPDTPVVYVGTFSLLLYPGLRIGYVIVPRWAATEFGPAIEALYRTGHAVEQRALARFLESGHPLRHLRAMAPIYHQRQSVLREALLQRFGPETTILGGQAGLHLTTLLPPGIRDTDIVEHAARNGVVARALSSYTQPGTATESLNGLVLGYGMAEAERIPSLVARLTDS